MWASWIASASSSACGNLLSLNYVEYTILPKLTEAGLRVPPRRGVQGAIESLLGTLPVRDMKFHHGAKFCSFAHLLILVWLPLLEYMDTCTCSPAPAWTTQLALHHSLLLNEMAGVVPSADEHLDIDTWVEYVQKTLLRTLQVKVPSRLILHVMGPLVPFNVAPTRANALTLLLSGAGRELVGPAMAAQAMRLILADVAEVPVGVISAEEMASKVRQDLVDILDKQLNENDEEARPAKRLRRTSEAIAETMRTKTLQALYILRNRVGTTRMLPTIQGAAELLQAVAPADRANDMGDAMSELCSERAIRRHMLFLDGAVDRVVSEHLMNARDAGTLAGVALATDESPPSQPRFRGLRFQITVIYAGAFKNLRDWSTCDDPPILKTNLLADICHCPGKKGADVSRVIEKQLARIGLSAFDVVSGTGDGGGENEGSQGVHAYFENLNPGYVRRRCLPHIAWRTCDAAIKASGLSYRALAAYLTEGITWTRLRELATRTMADGGLNLFRDGSAACKELFGKAPGAIIDTRPETDLEFLKILRAKEHLLHRLATRDLEQRNLHADTKAAVLGLGDIKLRIFRRILQEILERCMFLLYWTAKHESISAETTWDELLQRAVALILSLEIKPDVVARLSGPCVYLCMQSTMVKPGLR